MLDSHEHLHVILNENIGFIGGGDVAKAICEGMVKKGIIKYSQIFVSDPQAELFSWWKEKGANICTENGHVIDKVETYIILAVEPSSFNSAIANIYNTASLPMKPKLLASVVPGVQLEKLDSALYSLQDPPRVIRIMPNTALTVRKGYTVFCPGTREDPYDILTVKNIFRTSGLCRQFPESLFNAIGTLTDSGLAFIYLIIEAFADAGAKQGISRTMVFQMAAQTTLGAAKMVLDTRKPLAVLKDEVCSLRGTTMDGIYALEAGGVRGAMFKAVEAAISNSEDL